MEQLSTRWGQGGGGCDVSTVAYYWRSCHAATCVMLSMVFVAVGAPAIVKMRGYMENLCPRFRYFKCIAAMLLHASGS